MQEKRPEEPEEIAECGGGLGPPNLWGPVSLNSLNIPKRDHTAHKDYAWMKQYKNGVKWDEHIHVMLMRI